ncbi:MAG: hypothetical protein RLZZ292_1835, partial [Bacteroidota bacterium]
YTPLMERWLAVEEPVLDMVEQHLFDKKLKEAVAKLRFWNEEKLKMQFITYILLLGHIEDTEQYSIFYEKKLEHTVKDVPLSVQTDFMIATGRNELYKQPFFHFQEYKPEKNPSGDSMSQLLQAMLIAQAQNNTDKPIYGCEIVGKSWCFVILEGTDYCISSTYESIKKADLLMIIAILRKFKVILETELIVD